MARGHRELTGTDSRVAHGLIKSSQSWAASGLAHLATRDPASASDIAGCTLLMAHLEHQRPRLR
jgi:hypothetical protein